MKNHRKIIIALCSFFLYIVSCNEENNRNQTAESENSQAQINSAIASRDSVENLFSKTLSEIDSSIAIVFNTDKNKNSHPSYSKTAILSREAILKNIKTASSILKQNRQKIGQLKSQLNKMKIENTGLSKRLEQYDKKMKDYEEQLGKLKDEVMNKDLQISDLHRDVDKLKYESIMNKRFADKYEEDLNTAYYTKGTYKELKKSGVIKSKGGLLGIGSREMLNEYFPDQMFAKIDIRKIKSIPVNAKKVKLITEHPDSSYVLKDSAGMVTFLEIKDPNEFWKISRHMVLVVNK